MITPQITNDVRSWDNWRAFHCAVTLRGASRADSWSTPMFTLFDTGELVGSVFDPNPDDRGTYSALNLDVVMVGENCPPLLLPDGSKVPKAWMTQGKALKGVVDLDTKRFIALGGVDPQQVPERFVLHNSGIPRARVSCYFPGPRRDGIGGTIKLSRPNSLLTPEVRERAEEMFAAARMMVTLSNRGANVLSYSFVGPIDPLRMADIKDLSELTEIECAAIRRWDSMGRSQLRVPYLMADI